jgi:hypothetical protein
MQQFVSNVIAQRTGSLFEVTRERLLCLTYEREYQMKKAFFIAALFAIAGIASAQNTPAASATSASASAAKPVATAEAAKPAAKASAHKKTHAKKAAKKDVAKADAPAPAK